MKTGRKISGGKYKPSRKKKKSEHIRHSRMVVVGKEKKKKIRARGNHAKTVLLSTDKANLLNPKTGKSKIVRIKSVLETPANRFLKKFIIKGAIIQTEAGKARVTNRPGQEPSVQAVLIE